MVTTSDRLHDRVGNGINKTQFQNYPDWGFDDLNNIDRQIETAQISIPRPPQAQLFQRLNN